MELFVLFYFIPYRPPDPHTHVFSTKLMLLFGILFDLYRRFTFGGFFLGGELGMGMGDGLICV